LRWKAVPHAGGGQTKARQIEVQVEIEIEIEIEEATREVADAGRGGSWMGRHGSAPQEEKKKEEEITNACRISEEKEKEEIAIKESQEEQIQEKV
jgi:hypothetical protein